MHWFASGVACARFQCRCASARVLSSHQIQKRIANLLIAITKHVLTENSTQEYSICIQFRTEQTRPSPSSVFLIQFIKQTSNAKPAPWA